MGAESIGIEFDETADLDVVASASKDGRQTIVSIVNGKEDESVEVSIRMKECEGRLPGKATATVLTGKLTDENTFDTPDKVKPKPAKIEGKQDKWNVLCEPFSLTVVTFGHAD